MPGKVVLIESAAQPCLLCGVSHHDSRAAKVVKRLVGRAGLAAQDLLKRLPILLAMGEQGDDPAQMIADRPAVTPRFRLKSMDTAPGAHYGVKPPSHQVGMASDQAIEALKVLLGMQGRSIQRVKLRHLGKAKILKLQAGSDV